MRLSKARRKLLKDRATELSKKQAKLDQEAAQLIRHQEDEEFIAAWRLRRAQEIEHSKQLIKFVRKLNKKHGI